MSNTRKAPLKNKRRPQSKAGRSRPTQQPVAALKPAKGSKQAAKTAKKTFASKAARPVVSVAHLATETILPVYQARRVYYLYGALTVLYFALIFATNPAQTLFPNPHQEATNRWLSLAIRFPLELIWLAAFFGYARLARYARTIKGSPDGKHFHTIANGLLVSTVGMPISFILSNALTLLYRHHILTLAVSTILRNYINLLVVLLMFSIVSEGAFGLTTIIKRRISMRMLKIISLLSVVIGVFYCFLVFNDTHINPVGVPTATSTGYFMPNWLVLATLVVPYLYAWVIGFCGTTELLLYQKYTPGKLYRRALLQLTIGTGIVLVSSIAIQYTSTLSRELFRMSLLGQFFVSYTVYTMTAIGFILIAIGANRLQKIEEI